MTVFLYTEGEFSNESQRRSFLRWAREFAREIEIQGATVTLFDPSTHKLLSSHIVHAFGYTNSENWYWLKRLTAAVIVSPFPGSNLSQPPFQLPLALRLVHQLRKTFRSNLPVLDAVTFQEAVDQFCFFSDLNPKEAAKQMFPIYASLNH